MAGLLAHTPLTTFSKFFPVLFLYRGPILVEDNVKSKKGLELLLKEVISYAKHNHFLSVDIKAPATVGKHYDFFRKCRCEIVPTGEEYSIAIDLHENLSAIWNSFRKDARKRIKKSLGHLEFKEVETETELSELYEVYLHTAMRRSFSPFPAEFFRSIRLRLKPRGLAQLLIAKYRGKTIGGKINLIYRNTAETFISCSYEQMWKFSPNHGLMWYSIYRSKDDCKKFIIRCLPRQFDKTKQIDYYTFKTGFGGEIFLEYVHFSRVINPLLDSLTKRAIWLTKLLPAKIRRNEGNNMANAKTRSYTMTDVDNSIEQAEISVKPLPKSD